LSKALRMAPMLATIGLAMAFLTAPAFAATTYTVSVQTDAASYSAAQTITTSGTVSPAPGPNTAVVVTIKNPAGTVVDIGDDPVNPSTGAYTQVTVAGGSSAWIAGTYSVNATWGGNSSTATMTTTFTYSPTVTSTTTSSTTTSTTSSSTSKTTSSSSTSTLTTSTPPSPPPVTTTTSSSTSTSTVSSSTSSSSATGGTTESSGLGSLTYVIVAVVVIIIVGLGVVMWRRRVATGFAKQPTTP
jgi:hypothetical protein